MNRTAQRNTVHLQQQQLLRLVLFFIICILFHLFYLLRQSSIQYFYQHVISYPQFLYQLQHVSQNETLQHNLHSSQGPFFSNVTLFQSLLYSLCFLLYFQKHQLLSILIYFVFLSQPSIHLISSTMALLLFWLCPISSIMEISYCYYYGYIFQHSYVLLPLLIFRCMVQMMNWICFVTTGMTLLTLLKNDTSSPQQPRILILEEEQDTVDESSVAQVLLQASHAEGNSILLQLCVTLLHEMNKLKKQVQRLRQKPNMELFNTTQLVQRREDLQQELIQVETMLKQKHPSTCTSEEQHHNTTTITTCVICMDQEAVLQMKPCTHCCYCFTCYEMIKEKELDLECPICRQTVESVSLKTNPFVPFCEQIPLHQFHCMGQSMAQQEVAKIMKELKTHPSQWSSKLQHMPSIYRQVVFGKEE